MTLAVSLPWHWFYPTVPASFSPACDLPSSHQPSCHALMHFLLLETAALCDIRARRGHWGADEGPRMPCVDMAVDMAELAYLSRAQRYRTWFHIALQNVTVRSPRNGTTFQASPCIITHTSDAIIWLPNHACRDCVPSARRLNHAWSACLGRMPGQGT